MRSPLLRLAAIAWLATFAVFTLATPASAQLRGLKNRVQGKTGQDAPKPATDDRGAQAGTVVLTEDVVNQLLTGLQAGQAERKAATKEDTPYGRYKRAEAAYAEAEPKCQAAQQTWPTRAAKNEKMMDKYGALTEKMVAAQGKGDYKLMGIYQDSAMSMMDPSCAVKKPDQPKDYYEVERTIETRAEAKEVQASGLSRNDLALVKERAIMILGSSPPPDASSMEKSAVSAKADQLKPLLGMRDPAPVQVAKPEPAPAPPSPAAQPSPEISAHAQDMSACMTKNMQDHQAEIEEISKRAQAAQKAGDRQKLMAYADTLQRIQMAGCR